MKIPLSPSLVIFFLRLLSLSTHLSPLLSLPLLPSTSSTSLPSDLSLPPTPSPTPPPFSLPLPLPIPSEGGRRRSRETTEAVPMALDRADLISGIDRRGGCSGPYPSCVNPVAFPPPTRIDLLATTTGGVDPMAPPTPPWVPSPLHPLRVWIRHRRR